MTGAYSTASLIDTQQAGRLATGVALTAVVSVITLSLMFSGLPFFGPVNDITNAAGGLLTALLVWQFHALLRQRAPGTAPLLLMSAWVGAAAIIVNSVLVAFGLMHWMIGGMYTAIGLGLQGIWLLGLNRLLGGEPFLTPGIARLGTMVALAMLVGLLAGPLLASGASLDNSPLVGLAYIGAAAGWLLYPVWAWLVGRRLLSPQSS